ncbi:hypothetical protein B9T07_01545 [Limnospira fusiformis CCALA 023]
MSSALQPIQIVSNYQLLIITHIVGCVRGITYRVNGKFCSSDAPPIWWSRNPVSQSKRWGGFINIVVGMEN